MLLVQVIMMIVAILYTELHALQIVLKRHIGMKEVVVQKVKSLILHLLVPLVVTLVLTTLTYNLVLPAMVLNQYPV
jgi:hypothetical protein